MYRDKLSTFLKKHFTFHFSRSFSKYSKKLREKSCPTFASKSRFLIFFFRTNFHPRSRSKNRCDIINNLLEYISTIRTFVRNFFLLQFKEAIKGQVYPQPGRGGGGEGRYLSKERVYGSSHTPVTSVPETSRLTIPRNTSFSRRCSFLSTAEHHPRHRSQAKGNLVGNRVSFFCELSSKYAYLYRNR